MKSLNEFTSHQLHRNKFSFRCVCLNIQYPNPRARYCFRKKHAMPLSWGRCQRFLGTNPDIPILFLLVHSPTETIFKVDVLNPISSCCFLNLLMVKSREMSSWFSIPATCKYNMFDVQHVQIAFIFPTPHAAMQTAANLKFKLLQFQTALVLPCHCTSLK